MTPWLTFLWKCPHTFRPMVDYIFWLSPCSIFSIFWDSVVEWLMQYTKSCTSLYFMQFFCVSSSCCHKRDAGIQMNWHIRVSLNVSLDSCTHVRVSLKKCNTIHWTMQSINLHFRYILLVKKIGPPPPKKSHIFTLKLQPDHTVINNADRVEKIITGIYLKMAPKNVQFWGSLAMLTILTQNIFPEFWFLEWSLCNNVINHGLKICCCNSEVRYDLWGEGLTRRIHVVETLLETGHQNLNTIGLIFTDVMKTANTPE